MGKSRYVCEYCNKSFEDSHEARQRHNRGRNHRTNVKLYYDSFEAQEKRAAADGTSAQAKSATIQHERPVWALVNFVSNQGQTFTLKDLPPSMHPAPPEAFYYCHSTWG